MNKVLIGIPTYAGHSFCRIEFINRLIEIKKHSDPDIYVVWNGEKNEDTQPIKDYENSGCRIHRILNNTDLSGMEMLVKKQNMIRKYFLEGVYTHLLMLESDNIPQINIIDELISHNVPVVTALYLVSVTQSMVKKVSGPIAKYLDDSNINDIDDSDIGVVFVIKQTPVPSLWGIFGSDMLEHIGDKTTSAVRLWSLEDYIKYKSAGNRLVPVFSGGVGCVLFKKDAMEKIPFKCNSDIPNMKKLFSDFIWYYDAYNIGINCYVDLDCLVMHRHFDAFNLADQDKKWFHPKSLDKCKVITGI